MLIARDKPNINRIDCKTRTKIFIFLILELLESDSSLLKRKSYHLYKSKINAQKSKIIAKILKDISILVYKS